MNQDTHDQSVFEKRNYYQLPHSSIGSKNNSLYENEDDTNFKT